VRRSKVYSKLLTDRAQVGRPATGGSARLSARFRSPPSFAAHSCCARQLPPSGRKQHRPARNSQRQQWGPTGAARDSLRLQMAAEPRSSGNDEVHAAQRNLLRAADWPHCMHCPLQWRHKQRHTSRAPCARKGPHGRKHSRAAPHGMHTTSRRAPPELEARQPREQATGGTGPAGRQQASRSFAALQPGSLPVARVCLSSRPVSGPSDIMGHCRPSSSGRAAHVSPIGNAEVGDPAGPVVGAIRWPDASQAACSAGRPEDERPPTVVACAPLVTAHGATPRSAGPQAALNGEAHEATGGERQTRTQRVREAEKRREKRAPKRPQWPRLLGPPLGPSRGPSVRVHSPRGVWPAGCQLAAPAGLASRPHDPRKLRPHFPEARCCRPGPPEAAQFAP